MKSSAGRVCGRHRPVGKQKPGDISVAGLTFFNCVRWRTEFAAQKRLSIGLTRRGKAHAGKLLYIELSPLPMRDEEQGHTGLVGLEHSLLSLLLGQSRELSDDS